MSPTGMLSVQKPGIQVIQAFREEDEGDREETNWIFVLAGFNLDSIDLQAKPLDDSTFSLVGLLNDGDFSNSPLILTSEETAWIQDKGRIRLEAIEFKFLGAGEHAPTVNLKDLMAIESLSPASPYADVFQFLDEMAWGGDADNNIDALHVLDDDRILFTRIEDFGRGLSNAIPIDQVIPVEVHPV